MMLGDGEGVERTHAGVKYEFHVPISYIKFLAYILNILIIVFEEELAEIITIHYGLLLF